MKQLVGLTVIAHPLELVGGVDPPETPHARPALARRLTTRGHRGLLEHNPRARGAPRGKPTQTRSPTQTARPTRRRLSDHQNQNGKSSSPPCTFGASSDCGCPSSGGKSASLQFGERSDFLSGLRSNTSLEQAGIIRSETLFEIRPVPTEARPSADRQRYPMISIFTSDDILHPFF